MNIITWLLESGIAKNEPHARAIIAGLRLGELYAADDYDGIKARARLYRDWRNSKIYPDKDTASCFVKAIAGVPVPQLEFVRDRESEEFIPLKDVLTKYEAVE